MIGHLDFEWDERSALWVITQIELYKYRNNGIAREAVRKLIDYLGAFRSPGIEPWLISPDAQKMLVKLGAHIEYIGYNKIIPDLTGYVYILNKTDFETTAGKDFGGIDLTSDKALSVQNSGASIDFHIDPVHLAQWQGAQGVVFDIVSIQPVLNIPQWLGLN